MITTRILNTCGGGNQGLGSNYVCQTHYSGSLQPSLPSCTDAHGNVNTQASFDGDSDLFRFAVQPPFKKLYSELYYVLLVLHSFRVVWTSLL